MFIKRILFIIIILGLTTLSEGQIYDAVIYDATIFGQQEAVVTENIVFGGENVIFNGEQVVF